MCPCRVCYAFSPLVEETDGHTVVLDVEGCELLFVRLMNWGMRSSVEQQAQPGRRARCRPNVAVAANPDAGDTRGQIIQRLNFYFSRRRAHWFGRASDPGSLPGIRFKVQRPNSKDKAPKPKSPDKTLDFGLWSLEEKKVAEIFETLRLWGVRTFREFAVLPVAGVSSGSGKRE